MKTLVKPLMKTLTKFPAAGLRGEFSRLQALRLRWAFLALGG